MQTTGSINNHHVGIIGLGALQGVEGYAGGVATHLLLHHGHTYALAPDAQLLHGSSTECIGGTQINLLAGLLKLPGQLTYRCGLAHAVHANHQDDVGLMVCRQVPVIIIICVVLSQQRCNLFSKDSIQLTG